MDTLKLEVLPDDLVLQILDMAWQGLDDELVLVQECGRSPVLSVLLMKLIETESATLMRNITKDFPGVQGELPLYCDKCCTRFTASKSRYILFSPDMEGEAICSKCTPDYPYCGIAYDFKY